MESSIRFGRVKGIPIGAHWSSLLIFGLIVWSLAGSVFPSSYPDHRGGTYLAMGVVAAVGLFASIVLHELGHTFRALREGMPHRLGAGAGRGQRRGTRRGPPGTNGGPVGRTAMAPAGRPPRMAR